MRTSTTLFKRNPWGFNSRDEWLACFKEQFNKHKSCDITSRKYDLIRDPSTPSWTTIARYCNIDTWSGLIDAAGIKTQARSTGTAVNVHVDQSISPLLKDIELALSCV